MSTFEYAMRGWQREFEWFVHGLPQLLPSDFLGKLTRQPALAMMREHPPPYITLGRGGVRYLYRSVIEWPNVGRVFVFERPDRNELALVRQAGTMTLSVTDGWQANGMFRVTVQTLAGFKGFDEEYGLNAKCDFNVVKGETKYHLVGIGKISPHTKLVFVRGTTVINGKVILKKGRPQEAWERFFLNRKKILGSMFMRKITWHFGKKEGKACMCIVGRASKSSCKGPPTFVVIAT